MKRYLLTVRVVLQAREMGLSTDQFHDMVQHSARITHADGNRRYHEYLFNVEGDRVLAFRKLSEQEIADEEHRVRTFTRPPREQPDYTFYRCETCRDTGKMLVFDQCDYCQGRGSCTHCDEGLVPRKVNCPDCPASKRGNHQRSDR